MNLETSGIAAAGLLALELDPKLTEDICAHLSSGTAGRTACESVGLSELAAHNYIRVVIQLIRITDQNLSSSPSQCHHPARRRFA